MLDLLTKHVVYFILLLIFLQDLKIIADFHHFASVNAHLFVEKPLPDLVQMALSESMESEVYKQAQDKAMQLAAEGKLYLDWR